MAADPKSAIAEVLKWRRALQTETGAARAASARLRRAPSVLDALLLEETLDLIRAAREAEPKAPVRDFDQRLVVLAMTLPRIADEFENLARPRPGTDERRPRAGWRGTAPTFPRPVRRLGAGCAGAQLGRLRAGSASGHHDPRRCADRRRGPRA